MSWTKQQSRNAVAAKARKQLAQGDLEYIDLENSNFIVNIPRTKAKWRIQIRDLEFGDSLTLTLTKLHWKARYLDSDYQKFSASQIGKIINNILKNAP